MRARIYLRSIWMVKRKTGNESKERKGNKSGKESIK